MSVTQWAELYLEANQKFGGLTPKPTPGYVPVWWTAMLCGSHATKSGSVGVGQVGQ